MHRFVPVVSDPVHGWVAMQLARAASTLVHLRALLLVLLVLAAALSCRGQDEESVSAPPRWYERSLYPGPDDTGVPEGRVLKAYEGPMVITDSGTTIDSSAIEGALVVDAPEVTITRSMLTGTIVVTERGSVSLSDSTVDAGTYSEAAISPYNFTLERVEVIGARASVGCSARCAVRDSWLHAQYIEPGSDWHGDGFLTNGGVDMTVEHNTIACDSEPTGAGGACSAALAAYGDFEPVVDLAVSRNFFVESPAGFCLYGGHDPAKAFGAAPRGVRITDNVFARGTSGNCGVYGAVTAVAPPGGGNVFSGNVWDDGTALDPAEPAP